MNNLKWKEARKLFGFSMFFPRSSTVKKADSHSYLDTLYSICLLLLFLFHVVDCYGITETSEDISPYATFQLSEPSTLAQNTMLHSFMYHEHPVTEGCASPPPSSSVQRNSPYYNIVSSNVLFICLLAGFDS